MASSAKQMLNQTFSGLQEGFHTLMDKIPNNPLLAKENAVELTLIFIIVIIAFLIFFWLYNTFNLSNTNCANLEKVYASGRSSSKVDSISPHNIKFSGNLVDYYISTAYNCCCAGNFKNDFVDSKYTTPEFCALTNCIQQGARCLDFEIYSYKDVPVIAASSVNSFNIKETFNYLDFDAAMKWLGTIAFNNTFCRNNEDPLILNLRIMSDNIKIYPMIALSILKHIPDEHQLDAKYNIINYCNNLCKLPLLTFYQKVIVIIDLNTFNNLNKICPGMQKCPELTNTSEPESQSTLPAPIPSISGVPCLEPNLLEVIHMHSGSHYFNTLRESDLTLNGSQPATALANETMLTLLLPDFNANAKNNNPILGMGYGCQMVGMSFQTFDANLEYYLLFFTNGNSAFVYKPDYLRYIPKYITLPPSKYTSLDLSPQTATMKTAFGNFDFATFPHLPSSNANAASDAAADAAADTAADTAADAATDAAADTATDANTSGANLDVYSA